MCSYYINKVDNYRGFDIIISHKYKFIYCLIQKCGSSSVLYSLYKHEYNKIYNPNIIIWNQVKICNDFLLSSIHMSFQSTDALQEFSQQYKDYRKFIVIRNVKDRLLSWMNFTTYLSTNIINTQMNPNDFYDIMYTIYCDIYRFHHKQWLDFGVIPTKVEYHCLPQSVFYRFFSEAFKDSLEIVDIKDLSNYLYEEYGLELTKNNENRNKILLDLDVNQSFQIDELCKHDNIWEIIETQKVWKSRK